MGAKWTGLVAQVVEYLLCKCKALSPHPSPTQQRTHSNIVKVYSKPSVIKSTKFQNKMEQAYIISKGR
jgi:hypothetical protein